MDDLALYIFVLYLLLIFQIHIRKHIAQLSKEVSRLADIFWFHLPKFQDVTR